MSDNIQVLDATANSVTLRSTDSAGAHLPHHIVESSALPTGAATSAKQDTLLAAVATETTSAAILAKIIADPLTDTELRATPVPVSGSVSFDSFPAIAKDAFGRLRTSDPGYRFDSQFTYGVDADLWDSSVTGGTPGTITHDSTERWVELEASVNGAGAVLQSHYHAPYTPGRGQLAFITFLFGSTPGNGAWRKAGYWDGSNGVYLMQTSSAISIVLASDTAKGDETVAKASWNIDPMDGSGPSGLTLDLTKMQILVVQLQALYVGRVTVGFDIGGTIIPVHAFDCANGEVVPYIQQASLPVRYEVSTSDTSVAMYAVCASVISEGGRHLHDMDGRTFAYWNENTSFVNPANGGLLAIQVKDQINSIDHNALVVPTGLDISCATAQALIKVHLNPTYTGTPTWTSVDASSAVNYATDAVINGAGRIVDAFYVPATNTARSSAGSDLLGKIVLSYSHLLGAGDTLAISVTNGAGSPDVSCGLRWKEIR